MLSDVTHQHRRLNRGVERCVTCVSDRHRKLEAKFGPIPQITFAELHKSAGSDDVGLDIKLLTHGSQALSKWRIGWDSNPRSPFGLAGFQDRNLKPLGHLSNSHKGTGIPVTLNGLAGKAGLEPTLTESESVVLPLNYFPRTPFQEQFMAEAVGFEPTIPLQVCRISNAVL